MMPGFCRLIICQWQFVSDNDFVTKYWNCIEANLQGYYDTSMNGRLML